MTSTSASPTPTATTHDDPETAAGGGSRAHRRRWLIAAIGAGVVVAVATVAWPTDDGAGWERTDLTEQGTTDALYAADSARLQRRADGVAVEVDVPAPEPGTYEYPTHDMIPPWVESHPPISQGASDAPEAFTLWLFAFNDPSQCTDTQCDNDDVGPDTAARGAVYQVDGRIAEDGRLRFAGNVRIGQVQLDGARLDDPAGAEIHLAVVPHGRALAGSDAVVQLNTPVGNPSLWWGARFPVD